ncbi:hypothetical protein DYB32_006356 [Aphanomyces invadans]|uniref:Nudix hydrolase domain-containing protein n=1 Tax=Aphanomyces invadans TaxID=157072 RepID=A0A3R6VJN4_9STRA|nr:hypothetical protein DYB32_006356 [Aphanomyces invadans]
MGLAQQNKRCITSHIVPHISSFAILRTCARAGRSCLPSLVLYSGLYYVQRRSSTKDYCPGLLEPMAGGVVKFDEAYDESAARELEEEMGIRGVPLTHIATFPYSSPPMLIWRGLYDCVYDGPVTKQDEEVSEILLLSEQQILDREQDITPDGMFAFRAYLATRPRAI